MTANSFDMLNTIEADSTQINADELTQTPRVVTITGVNKGSADQPVNIDVAEFPGKAFRPCKSMRRVMVAAWGPDASTYVGRRIAIYNDPSVKWGGQSVGGVRIAAMSHIDKPITLALTETRGKRKPHRIDPLPDAPPAPNPITDDEAAEFTRNIAQSSTVIELEAVATALKSCDLGKHRKRLLDAWSARKGELPEVTQ